MRLVALSFFALALVGCWDPLDRSRGYYGGGYYPEANGSSPRETTGASFASECVDPSGFGGRGCFKCEPKTNEELLNACTTSRFEAFDNTARIVGYSSSN